ncbi:hypothetical protein EDC04DRAFT_171062 [Pisolithus marmoratus]|nr:hypothetical protein EDC04DRAFT_171062 [Pisolithus marmoratus]
MPVKMLVSLIVWPVQAPHDSVRPNHILLVARAIYCAFNTMESSHPLLLSPSTRPYSNHRYQHYFTVQTDRSA